MPGVFLDQGRDAFEPDGAGGLDEDRVARRSRSSTSAERAASATSDAVGGSVEVRPCARRRRDDELDPELAESGAISRGSRRSRSELGHLAEDRDARRPAARSSRSSSAARIEIGFALYASLTTSRRPAARRLAAPAAEPDRGGALGRAVERQPERVVAVSAATTFPRGAAARTAARGARRPRDAERHASRHATTARSKRPDDDVVAERTARAGLAAGTTAMPPGGSARSPRRSRGDVLDGADELEVLRPIDVTSASVGRATAQSSAICPSPRMPISVTRTRVSGSSGEHRERQAELVVPARVRGDGRRHRRAERREDVLRRRLAAEPTTATTWRARRADERGERRERASWSCGTRVAAPRAASSTKRTPVLSATKRSPGRRRASRRDRDGRPRPGGARSSPSSSSSISCHASGITRACRRAVPQRTRLARASRATSGRRTDGHAGDLLTLLVALAGDQRRRRRRRRPRSRSRSRAPVEVDLDVGAGPWRISSTIASGSSRAGLSFVTITRSRAPGDAPHLGALRAVAVAARAEDDRQPAVAELPRRLQRAASASGLCA
jgi:hypothetical protein